MGAKMISRIILGFYLFSKKVRFVLNFVFLCHDSANSAFSPSVEKRTTMSRRFFLRSSELSARDKNSDS